MLQSYNFDALSSLFKWAKFGSYYAYFTFFTHQMNLQRYIFRLNLQSQYLFIIWIPYELFIELFGGPFFAFLVCPDDNLLFLIFIKLKKPIANIDLKQPI